VYWTGACELQYDQWLSTFCASSPPPPCLSYGRMPCTLSKIAWLKMYVSNDVGLCGEISYCLWLNCAIQIRDLASALTFWPIQLQIHLLKDQIGIPTVWICQSVVPVPLDRWNFHPLKEFHLAVSHWIWLFSVMSLLEWRVNFPVSWVEWWSHFPMICADLLGLCYGVATVNRRSEVYYSKS